jgi:hypothetical protein
VFADADLRTVTIPWLITNLVTVSAQNTPPTSRGDSEAILHFVGRPVQGDGEIVLDIGGLDDRVPSESLGSAATGSGRSGTTVRLASLDLQKVALVVIQARPDDPARRAASDRRKASRLRALAADALAAGAETVVIIPSLPGPLADLVITSLARRLGPMTFRARIAEQARRLYVSQHGAPTYRQVDLVAWLAEARELVEAWPLPDSSHEGPVDDEIVDAYVELAFDITICTRPAPRHKAEGQPVKA